MNYVVVAVIKRRNEKLARKGGHVKERRERIVLRDPLIRDPLIFSLYGRYRVREPRLVSSFRYIVTSRVSFSSRSCAPVIARNQQITRYTLSVAVRPRLSYSPSTFHLVFDSTPTRTHTYRAYLRG